MAPSRARCQRERDRRHLEARGGGGVGADALVAAAARHALLSGLVQLFRVVPVTARDLDSFSRVSIEGLPLKDGAIIANGAIPLRPGTMTPDPEWDEELAPHLAAWADPLAEMAAALLEAEPWPRGAAFGREP